MSDIKELEKITVFTAGSYLFSHITQIAGIVAGFAAVTYLVGWREVYAYYLALGAPWAASLLPSTSVMQTSMDMMSILILSCFYSFHLYSGGQIGAKGLNRLILITVVSAMIAFGINVFGVRWFDAAIVNSCAAIAANLWAAYAGLILTDLIIGLANKDLRWDASHLHLAYGVLFIGCWIAPSQLGQARAAVDIDPSTSSLATVLIKEMPHGPRWKLVTAFEGHVLLVQPSTESMPRQFKIINSEEVMFIHTVPKKHSFMN